MHLRWSRPSLGHPPNGGGGKMLTKRCQGLKEPIRESRNGSCRCGAALAPRGYRAVACLPVCTAAAMTTGESTLYQRASHERGREHGHTGHGAHLKALGWVQHALAVHRHRKLMARVGAVAECLDEFGERRQRRLSHRVGQRGRGVRQVVTKAGLEPACGISNREQVAALACGRGRVDSTRVRMVRLRQASCFHRLSQRARSSPCNRLPGCANEVESATKQ